MAMRQVLLASCVKLVATRGFAATTTQAVLDDTGVSRGSLLHQFPTRELMMVATAEEALARMTAATEAVLLRDGDTLRGLMEYPDNLWRIQNDLPARAMVEIQLASRWDVGLQAGLTQAMAEVNDMIVEKIGLVAQHYGISDVPGLLQELFLLLTATQGLAINRELTKDATLIPAALVILQDRFVAALKSRLPGAGA